MAEKKVHKGYRFSNETLRQMNEISDWYGDIDQTQVLTISVAEMWHQRVGEIQKKKKSETSNKGKKTRVKSS
jgi:hypothetical protein